MVAGAAHQVGVKLNEITLVGTIDRFLQVNDVDVTAERLAQYEWYSGNIGTTVSAEYLPETVQPRPQTSRWLNGGGRHAVQVLAGETLAVEPLHPMYADTRSAVNTMRQANELCDRIDSPLVGVAVDVTFATDCPTVEKKEEGEIGLGRSASRLLLVG